MRWRTVRLPGNQAFERVKVTSDQGQATFIFVSFFLIVSFWLMIGTGIILLARTPGVGHDIQFCPTESEQVPQGSARPSQGGE